jgi:hypothetical protein
MLSWGPAAEGGMDVTARLGLVSMEVIWPIGWLEGRLEPDRTSHRVRGHRPSRCIVRGDRRVAAREPSGGRLAGTVPTGHRGPGSAPTDSVGGVPAGLDDAGPLPRSDELGPSRWHGRGPGIAYQWSFVGVSGQDDARCSEFFEASGNRVEGGAGGAGGVASDDYAEADVSGVGKELRPVLRGGCRRGARRGRSRR